MKVYFYVLNPQLLEVSVHECFFSIQDGVEAAD